MATTYTLRRKLFAETGEKKGISTAGKVLATAATTAGTFALARRGHLNFINKNISSQTNKIYKNVGRRLQRSSNEAISKFGTGMAKDAYGREIGIRSNALLKESGQQALTKEQTTGIKKSVLKDFQNGIK